MHGTGETVPNLIKKEELEKLGYKVEIGSQYNQSYVLIGWKK